MPCAVRAPRQTLGAAQSVFFWQLAPTSGTQPLTALLPSMKVEPHTRPFGQSASLPHVATHACVPASQKRFSQSPGIFVSVHASPIFFLPLGRLIHFLIIVPCRSKSSAQTGSADGQTASCVHSTPLETQARASEPPLSSTLPQRVRGLLVQSASFSHVSTHTLSEG